MEVARIQAQLEVKKENVEKTLAECLPLLETKLNAMDERIDAVDESLAEIMTVLKGVFVIAQKQSELEGEEKF